MDDQNGTEQEDNYIPLDLTMDRAAALYIVIRDGIQVSRFGQQDLQKKLGEGLTIMETLSGRELEECKETHKSFKDLLETTNFTLKHAIETLKEVEQIIRELDVEDTNKTNIIMP
jgi:hypothetical protein